MNDNGCSPRFDSQVLSSNFKRSGMNRVRKKSKVARKRREALLRLLRIMLWKVSLTTATSAALTGATTTTVPVADADDAVLLRISENAVSSSC
ncbi:unnamed protein product [Thelazia callipaeda]|uniref:BZIP domain-containing protein n=1 Tax=Thelazia callipaeda TaxID=103827 RepID=A0A0N5CY15_THECL|nr:unnamed protein product [Thelazia callipaeda]